MKHQLKIIQEGKKNTTCFYEHEKRGICCERKKCPHWISSDIFLNCAIICAKNGPYTLKEIGKFYNLSKMRICQLEKLIMDKLKTMLI
jgi:hypothetical protein